MCIVPFTGLKFSETVIIQEIKPIPKTAFSGFSSSSPFSNQTSKTLLHDDSYQWEDHANLAQEEVFQKEGEDGFRSSQKQDLWAAKFLAM